ncbi:uncharacterized protein UV8b_05094 [Ustilaginoidea virens]|uniref:Mitochondrial carrier protein PET8 n=1 Tax=Ustilaginoidea virens TaxID=1159556 RepID=A0A8E5MHS9_USTVR|nr:uncharacterized protein UV8b_05094 [Ustilaginoidea virens]QUC20853.1 hypothetical protein UV8b_05094 [Ustilaginoidea virens]
MNAARNVVGLQGLRAARQPAVRRGFSLSTSSRLGLKESSSQTDADYEKHKKDSLDKQKKGSGHWKPELASDSEEAVRADRSSEEDVAAMQERTKRAAEETSKSGTSMRDGM